MCNDTKTGGIRDCVRPLYWTGIAALFMVVIIAGVFFSKLSEMQQQIDTMQGQILVMQQIAASQGLACALPSYIPPQE